jgi:hypothetical protein
VGNYPLQAMQKGVYKKCIKKFYLPTYWVSFVFDTLSATNHQLSQQPKWDWAEFFVYLGKKTCSKNCFWSAEGCVGQSMQHFQNISVV